MAEIALRPAASDSPESARLLAAYEAELVSLGVTLNHGWAGGVTPAQLAPPHGAWLVGWRPGERGDDAVACGGVRLLSADVCEIKRMYVDPSARGAGLARRLLTALEDAGLALGASIARLDTGRDMAPAVGLYRRAGYVEIEDYNNNPDAGWWFEKQLLAPTADGRPGGMYPEVRAAVAADATPDFRADGFDLAAYREKVRLFNLAQPREDVAEATDVDADGVPCRLFTPADAIDGVIVHLHGGGFVFNDIDVHDGVCRRLANRSRRRVLSIGYRKPPERRFPAAIEDIDTVLGWLERQPINGGWAIHGDSAGANLALVGALRNPGRFKVVVLIYPFLDPTASFASYELGESSGFGGAESRWYWEQYADRGDRSDPDLAPLNATNLDTLPPTFVATAEFDPLRDEGEELARRIAETGVETVAVRCLGQNHGFWRHPQFAASEPLLRQGASFIDQHLS
ncbi:GNAT family N-acetyltransferase [Nocardioides sp.]|uniref:GNAT family N-acetyltransferase n=1 Tax=Nocardioides sp. TaxID=35761 RepID=UPI00286D8018|nr:GNAT family N-acetyltransferase [Nocardioides sp.]